MKDVSCFMTLDHSRSNSLHVCLFSGNDPDAEGNMRSFLAHPYCRDFLKFERGKTYLIMGQTKTLPKIGGKYDIWKMIQLRGNWLILFLTLQLWDVWQWRICYLSRNLIMVCICCMNTPNEKCSHYSQSSQVAVPLGWRHLDWILAVRPGRPDGRTSRKVYRHRLARQQAQPIWMRHISIFMSWNSFTKLKQPYSHNVTSF